MTDALVVQVAEAIKTEFSALTLSADYELRRSYADWDDRLSDVTTSHIQVDIVPAGSTSHMISRGKHEYVCVVHVLLRKLLGQSDRDVVSGRVKNASVDPLVYDLQKSYEYFAPSQPNQTGRRLAAVPEAVWRAAHGSEVSGIVAPYSRAMLRDPGQFSGWVRLIYAAPRAFA